MRQRTRWLSKWRYTKGHYIRAGIVNNLKDARDPGDVIRLQTHWLELSDIDWTMRVDEAMALITVLTHAVSHRLSDEIWDEQKSERAQRRRRD